MTKKTYIARFGGEIIGERTTQNRVYTHCVAIRWSEDHDRKEAHEYTAREHDLKNFEYYTAIAEDRAKHTPSIDDVVEACRKIDGGIDAYIARVRQMEIARFEERVKGGYYKLKVVTWCGRPDLAQKEASARRGDPRYAQIEIIPVEEKVKLKARG